MTDRGSEDEILNLAVTAVPALGRRCRAEAVWLDEPGDWLTPSGEEPARRPASTRKSSG
jgi:hypothetical protein